MPRIGCSLQTCEIEGIGVSFRLVPTNYCNSRLVPTNSYHIMIFCGFSTKMVLMYILCLLNYLLDYFLWLFK